MNIKMHRLPEQRNAIIEISTSHTKILLDEGVNLEENEVLKISDIIPYSFSDINAVFLSHYRTDYVTLVHDSLENVPVYIGKPADKIIMAAQRYKAKKPHEFAGLYKHGVPIRVGDITVTPYLVDDDKHGGYLYMIEGDKKRVIYTGDFRANGRKSFEEMLAHLPNKADVLISERGVITEEDINLVTERGLEEQATKLIGDTKGSVFVLLAVTDFDRAFTMFQAAKHISVPFWGISICRSLPIQWAI
jgi:ribonuclease J